MNWLKIGDVVQVSKMDHQFFFLFFLRRPGTNSTGGPKTDLCQYGHAVLDSNSRENNPCNLLLLGIKLEILITVNFI